MWIDNQQIFIDWLTNQLICHCKEVNVVLWFSKCILPEKLYINDLDIICLLNSLSKFFYWEIDYFFFIKQNSFYQLYNFTPENVICKSQKGLDSSILCGGSFTPERERTTIVGIFWINANHCLSAPLDLPVMPPYSLFSVVIASLHFSSNNVAWCSVPLEDSPTLLFPNSSQCCYQADQFQHNLSFGIDGSLSEYCRWWKTRSLVPLSPTSSPPPDVCIYQLGPVT